MMDDAIEQMALAMRNHPLLPCPFCGGEASFSKGETADKKPWFYVECDGCGAMGPNPNYAEHNIAVFDALAELWNGRAANK